MISGFQSGFLDFKVDFWIYDWISEFQSGFLDFIGFLDFRLDFCRQCMRFLSWRTPRPGGFKLYTDMTSRGLHIEYGRFAL